MDRRQFFRRKSSALFGKSLAALAVAGVTAFGPAIPAGGTAAGNTGGNAAAGPAGGVRGSSAAGVAGGAPALAPARLNVLSYNVCGGSCRRHLTLAQWTSRMSDRFTKTDADVVLFQELCRGQYDALRRALAGRYEARWAGTVGDNQGCGKQWGSGADSGANRRGFGLAVFVKGEGAIRQDRTWWLPRLGEDEPRALLCVDAVPRGRAVRVCNTHLDWRSDVQQVQAEFVAKLVSPWAAHVPVVLGGDLNAEPTESSMAFFYDHSGGRGVFQEVDETDKKYFGRICPKTAHRCRSGEGTDGDKKLDYIFLSRRHFSAAAGDAAREADVSDHALLRGIGVWRNLPPRADFTWHPQPRFGTR